MSLNRRHFLKATGTLALVGHAVPILGATGTRKFRTALIGSGWWGMNILREAMAAGKSQVVALCDAHQQNLDTGAEQVANLSGDKPRTFQDFRELLDKEKPEIVIIATPDHWHALTMIAAVKAGAHVYVEKPTGHTILESRAMVNAARSAGRVVQVGLHRRIGPHHVSGMQFLKSGAVGEPPRDAVVKAGPKRSVGRRERNHHRRR